MAHLVGIAGTHSTGKSTFVEALEQKLGASGKRVQVVRDVGSDAKEFGFPILRDHTFQSTLWIMSRVISLELEAERTADVVIVDRAVPDALGYLLAALEHRKAALPAEEITYLFDLVRHHSRRYRCLVKTRLNPEIALGPERDKDPEFRKLAAACIDRVFETLSIESIQLESGAERGAIDIVLRALNLTA